jgi:hypothetical protein
MASMTLDQCIELAQNLFDAATTSGQKYGSVLARQLGNIGYGEIVREAKCSGTTEGTITTVSGTREYSLASAYSSIVAVYYEDTAGNRTKLDPMFEQTQIDYTGYPVRYYLKANKIGFDPEPNDAYTVKYVYNAKPTADLTGTDTPSLLPTDFHHVLAYFITYQFFKIDKGDDTGGLNKWRNFYNEELQKLKDYLAYDQNQDTNIASG